MVRLRVVGLSAPYRSGLRDGWAWALNRAKEVGFSLTRNSNPVEVDLGFYPVLYKKLLTKVKGNIRLLWL